ncbi:MAG: CoB--CoM heterodisulfide reductase iron-sulfur subunit A family protein, partial [Deltaproteobacteria bacterium]|nr:CoB--CoM heterodisulfide reductase iron-sulfur subunit A family protein [Deltaproteobacteria bacterium]
IDPNNCIYLLKGRCKACEKVCPTNAIYFEDQKKELSIKVGAVILTPGADTYNPAIHDTYGYINHPNIVTSLEFERILSASGPFGGHLVRPSDRKEPKKIAWLQCIGSRDEHLGARGYCSAVCCTYAVKEAILAKEHSKGNLDTAIFYIDIRTHGKDFERYYNRAKDELGVRFIKSKVTNIRHLTDSGKNRIRYIDPAGDLMEEDFDIVVLSVGLGTTKDSVDLAAKLGIELDHYGFTRTESFSPVETSKPGFYVCGIFNSPQDIPSSVIESSAAAGMAGSRLSEVRWTLTKEEKLPSEIDIRGETPRIGVFVCRCGTNIAAFVDVPAVVEHAKQFPGVAYAEENMFACAQDSLDRMAKTISEHRLNRVVVAACTPRTHEPLFQQTLTNSGLNKYLFEMANIRNQCSWVHKNDKQKATQKAKDLVQMAVAKAFRLEPLKEPELTINQRALVIGGGVAGMTAARALSGHGYRSYLIERRPVLGGQANHLHQTWRDEGVQEYLNELIQAVLSDENIDVRLNTEIKNAEGFIGNFKTTVTKDGRDETLEHGVTIIASGAEELKPDDCLYGKDRRVITALELQDRLVKKDAALGRNKTVAFIQCVGSRIPDRPYCSKICCTRSIKSALELKSLNPEMSVFILYRDMRAYGLREDIYRDARSKGIVFIRYPNEALPDVTSNKTGIKITFNDTVLNRRMEINAQLLVLASAVVSEKDNPLARLYKVPLNADGFFAEAHVKLRPVDFATDGVFVCGLAHAPKPIDESISQAQAAAARAVTVLASKRRTVSGTVAVVNPNDCSRCGVCISICPYAAPVFTEKTGKAEIQSTLCKGCGLCVASCRSGAIYQKGFETEQIMTMIEFCLFDAVA